MGTAPLASHCPSYCHQKNQSIFITTHLRPAASQPAERAIPAHPHTCTGTNIHCSHAYADEELTPLAPSCDVAPGEAPGAGTDAQLKTQPRGHKPNPLAAAAASCPRHAAAVPASPRHPPASRSCRGSMQGSRGHQSVPNLPARRGWRGAIWSPSRPAPPPGDTGPARRVTTLQGLALHRCCAQVS